MVSVSIYQKDYRLPKFCSTFLYEIFAIKNACLNTDFLPDYKNIGFYENSHASLKAISSPITL